MQARLHRRRPQSEQFGGLLDAHLFDQPRHQHETEGLGQRIDGALKDLVDFVLGHGAFGIGLRGRERNDLSFGAMLRLDAVPIRRDPPAAQAAIGLVDDDARQPGAESRFAAKFVKPRKAADVAFLDNVFGFAVVLHNRTGEAKKPLVVLADEGFDRRLVAIARAGDQFILGGQPGPSLLSGHS